MRYLTYSFLLLLVSCKGENRRQTGSHLSEMTFSLDTVIIDPGDEILFLKYGLRLSDISGDGKYLYNFNMHDFTLEKINLTEMRLEEKVPFEAEGPNGAGQVIGWLRVYGKKELVLSGMHNSSLFSLDGKKLTTFNVQEFLLGGHLMEGMEMLRVDRILDDEAKRIYGLITTYSGSYAFGIFDFNDFEMEKFDLPSFDRVSSHDMILIVGGATIVNAPEVYIDRFANKVVMSNEVTSTLMWYDIPGDTLLLKPYQSQLTANEKVLEYKNKHETEEGFQKESRRLKQEINFLPPFWDAKFRCFYRFSYEELPASSAGGEIKAKVYLTVLDPDLNQIGEARVPQLTKRPAKHFAKDGKIWIYENMDDEMAFVRMSFMESK